jgi:hypothetical protein
MGGVSEGDAEDKVRNCVGRSSESGVRVCALWAGCSTSMEIVAAEGC